MAVVAVTVILVAVAVSSGIVTAIITAYLVNGGGCNGEFGGGGCSLKESDFNGNSLQS